MPEGDTIYRAARTLDRALGGQQIVSFTSELAPLARLEGTPEQITGRTIRRVEARGKHLLMFLSGELVIRSHMRMSGSWHIYRPGERWRQRKSAARIVIETEPWTAVGFSIVDAELLDPRQLETRSPVSRLGPDLLSPAFDHEEAVSRIKGRPEAEIGVALLNQTLLAGIGNVYKSETLFLGKINPFRRIEEISPDTLEEIVRIARDLLLLNVRADRRTEGIRATAPHLDPSVRLWVYGRNGKPCRKCDTAIMRRLQGDDARSTYWCPACQPSTI